MDGETFRAFLRLGLLPTTDAKAIKRAYAALLPDCDPEKEPGAWAELHAAYTAALRYARQEQVQPPQQTQTPHRTESEPMGYEAMFQNLGGLAQQTEREERERKQQYQQALKEAERQRAEKKRLQREKDRRELKTRLDKLRKRAIWRRLREQELRELVDCSAYRRLVLKEDAAMLLEPLLRLQNDRFEREALRVLIGELSVPDADGTVPPPTEPVLNSLPGVKRGEQKNDSATKPGGLIVVAIFTIMLISGNEDLVQIALWLIAVLGTAAVCAALWRLTGAMIRDPKHRLPKGYIGLWAALLLELVFIAMLIEVS